MVIEMGSAWIMVNEGVVYAKDLWKNPETFSPKNYVSIYNTACRSIPSM